MHQKDFESLSDEDKKIIKHYVDLINFDDDNLYLSYGVSSQKDSQLITKRLSKLSDTNENDYIISLVDRLNHKIHNYEKIKKKKEGFFGFLVKDSEEKEVNFRKDINKIKLELENYKMILLRNEVSFEKLKEENKEITDKMNKLLLAGKEKIKLYTNGAEEDIKRFNQRLKELNKSSILSLQYEAQIEYLIATNIDLQNRIEKNITDIDDMLEMFK